MPKLIGVKSPNSPYLSQAGGTTCSDEVDVFGSGTPGEKVLVRIWGDPHVDEKEVLVGDYNDDGVVDASDYALWRNAGFLTGDYNGDGVVDAADYTVWRSNFGQTNALPDGQYQIQACRAGDADCVATAVAAARWYDASSPYLALSVVVDGSLPIDPMSIVYTPTLGSAVMPSTLGWSWGRVSSPYLNPGETYDVSVSALCNNEVIEGFYTYDAGGNPAFSPLLMQDGKLIGSFTVPDKAQAAMGGQNKATLSVILDGSGNDMLTEMLLVAPYQEGMVMDRDGKALEGAEVALLYGDFFGLDDLWTERMELWQGPAYGQQNPQTTGADGKYAFHVQRGRYRLLVRKVGYQPFLSRPFTVQRPAWIGRDIIMTKALPELDDEVLLDFAITPLGFDPSISTLGWTGCLTCTAARCAVCGERRAARRSSGRAPVCAHHQSGPLRACRALEHRPGRGCGCGRGRERRAATGRQLHRPAAGQPGKRDPAQRPSGPHPPGHSAAGGTGAQRGFPALSCEVGPERRATVQRSSPARKLAASGQAKSD